MNACLGLGKSVHCNITVNEAKTVFVWATYGKLLNVTAGYMNTITGEVVYDRKATASETIHALSEIRQALISDDIEVFDCGCGVNVHMIMDILRSII